MSVHFGRNTHYQRVWSKVIENNRLIANEVSRKLVVYLDKVQSGFLVDDTFSSKDLNLEAILFSEDLAVNLLWGIFSSEANDYEYGVMVSYSEKGIAILGLEH